MGARRGSDAVISIDEFKTWVFSHRPEHTLGTAEVREYLRGIRGQNVSESTAKNYKAISIALSNSVTQSAKHKQEARDTAERSLRRVQAFATLITAVSVRPGSSTYRPRASQENEAVHMMSKALGHGDVITIDPSLYFNADDMSVMIHTGDKPSREVRAVPHNDHRAHFACFQLNNPDPATYLCVHITAMVSSGGLLATTVMRVTVKEREWKGPPGDNFVVVPIEGLCRGGNTFADTPRVGYIVLVKNTGEKESESVDQAFFRWFYSHVGLPFMRDARARVFSGWKHGDPVPFGMQCDVVASANFSKTKVLGWVGELQGAFKCRSAHTFLRTSKVRQARTRCKRC